MGRTEVLRKVGFHQLAKAVAGEDRDWSWRYEGALCKGRAQLFFPEHNSENRRPYKADEPCPVCKRNASCFFIPSERVAKSLCARCPVRRECIEAGMDEEYGIWGGTTPQERTRARQRNQTTEEVLDEMFEQAVAHGLAVKEA